MEETGEGSVGDMKILTRHAKAGGSFSYLFKVDTTKTNYLQCQFSPEDNGKTIEIKAGDVLIASETLNYTGSEELYTLKFAIPAEAIALAKDYELTDATTGKTEKRSVVRIAFSGINGAESAKLRTSAYTTTNYDNNAGITAITSNVGKVTKASATEYRVEVPLDTKEAKLDIALANAFGLLYVDGALVDDTKLQTVDLKQDETVVNLTVYAEDHTTKAEYKVTVAKVEEKVPTPVVPSLTLTSADEVAMKKAITLTANLANVTGTVKWTINTTKYGKLTANGNTATFKAGKKVGKVKITAEIGNLKVTKTIQVVEPVKKIKLNKKSITLKKNKTFKIKVTVTPKKATNKKVTYTVSKPGIVTVSASGKIKAKKKGTVTITVTSKSNPKAKAKIKVKVK